MLDDSGRFARGQGAALRQSYFQKYGRHIPLDEPDLMQLHGQSPAFIRHRVLDAARYADRPWPDHRADRRIADNGKVITIVTSLLAAFTGGYSTYAGGKSPVEHFTRAAAKEFAPRGISINAVAPGPMEPHHPRQRRLHHPLVSGGSMPSER